MSETVTLDVTTLEETVSVTTTDGGTVEISVVAQRGETGATGATGAAGPNSVTSATTSDGTCDLHLNGALFGLPDGDASCSISSNGIEIIGLNGFINVSKYVSVTTGSALTTAGAVTIATFGVSGQNFTFVSGTALTFDNTSFTYGTGAAAAHRTALGVPSGSGTSSGTNTGDQDLSSYVTLTGSQTLTNKTLTSPAINSAIIGTAATFNATTYTFGTGAAAALNTALGTTRVMRTTLATRTSGTMTADDTLVLPVLSGVTYRVRVHSLTKNSTATVGMVLRIDHPGITASGSDSVGHLMNGGGNAAITPSSSTSLTNSVNQNGQNLSTISEVILTPTANGNVSVVWAARVPAGVETAGLNIGSYLEVIRLS